MDDPEDRTLILSTIVVEIVIRRSMKPKGYNRLDPNRVEFRWPEWSISTMRARIAKSSEGLVPIEVEVRPRG